MLAIAMSLPWLIPVRTNPWPTLFQELAAGLAVVPLALLVIARWPGSLRADWTSISFTLAALVPLVQAMSGMFSFPGEAPLISIYLLGIAATLMIARRSAECDAGRATDALFAGLFIAALISSGLAMAQWLNVGSDIFVSSTPFAGRTEGNIGQANLLSSLLVWGLVGLWWAYQQRRVGGHVTLMAAAMLLVGIVSSQSRTGWIAVGLLLVIGLASPRGLNSAKSRPGLIALGMWFTLCLLAWPALTALLYGAQAVDIAGRLSPGLRPQLWAMMISGVEHQPWFGYGWNQGRLVQEAVHPAYADLGTGVQHAHNLVLDLLLWNGVPLGLFFSALLATWFLRQLRRVKSAQEILLLLALSTFFLHSMLELPHVHAYFLIPAALMMGTLNAKTGLPTVLQVPRLLGGLIVALLGGALVLSWVDYVRIEADVLSYRMRVARVGNVPALPFPKVYILAGLRSAMIDLRMKPRPNMGVDLERMRLTALRYPVESAWFNYAHAAALNHQPAEAQKALQRFCLLFPKDRCDEARTAWAAALAENPTMERVPFPVAPESLQSRSGLN
jgi:O-antigen ligase